MQIKIAKHVIIVGLILRMSGEAIAQGDTAVQKTIQPASATLTMPAGAEISRGERIEIEGKGFSIVPPVGWIVQKNLPRLSLALGAVVTGVTYARNITVMRSKGPVFINEETANNFEARISKNFPQSSTEIDKFSIRNHTTIPMEDGREAILIYTEFLGAGKSMMQAHIVLSSETDHYLVTFTDIAEHFENPSDAGGVLAEAWGSMTSIHLNTPNPVSDTGLASVLLWGGGMIALFLLVGMVRKKMAARAYRRVADSSEDEGELIAMSDPSELSEINTAMTSVSDERSQISKNGDQASHVNDKPQRNTKVKFSVVSPKKNEQKTEQKTDDGNLDMEFSEDVVYVDEKKFKIGA